MDSLVLIGGNDEKNLGWRSELFFQLVPFNLVLGMKSKNIFSLCHRQDQPSEALQPFCAICRAKQNAKGMALIGVSVLQPDTGGFEDIYPRGK